jgi:PAS domain S-box-containing protein
MSTASAPEAHPSLEVIPVRQAKDDVAPLNLLLVEDNPADVLHLQSTLDRHSPKQYATTVAATLVEAKSLLLKQEFAAVLLDLSLPDSQGLETIGKVAMIAPQLPIVVLTGVADSRIVPEAVRSGAQDYLLKGQSDGATIVRAIRYAMDRKQIEEQLRAKQRELETRNKELQEAQRRLESYRDRYINLYDFAPLGYVTLDEDGYVQEINLAGAKLLNKDREAITGYPFADYVAKEDLPAFSSLLKNCVQERAETAAELRLKTEGGRLIPVQLRSVPVENPGEGIAYCKTAITDITEVKKMEEKIRQSCDFLQTVIDAIPDPIMVIDRDYRIKLANRAARELSGKIDMVSQCLPCYQVSHHRDAPCDDEGHPCPLRETISAGAPMTVTHIHYDANGREVFVEVTAAPVFNEAGEVTHVIEACRDITDRKRAEESLAQERNLLRTLIDYLPDCIYIKDTQGRFLTANLATARLMGVATPNDLLGKSDWDFYPPELAAQYRADEEELLQSGQPLLDKDEPHFDANSVRSTVFTTKVPLKDDRGKIVGLVGISRDIPEHGPQK